MKKILDLKIIRKRRLSPYHFVLSLESPEELPEILPGQFVEILLEGVKEVFLRRPFSIHDVDKDNNQIDLLIQIVGNGTRALSYMEESDFINVMFPLGNHFTLPESEESVLLVGGGCGVAPLLYLSKVLSERNCDISILIGGKSDKDLLRIEDYEKYGSVVCTTEDGSHGEKGLVTEHTLFNSLNFDRIYSCGPEPMMKAIAKIAKKNDTFCEVSLENTMACGLGACLCCVVDTINGHLCTCTDGPVFNINDLKWQI